MQKLIIKGTQKFSGKEIPVVSGGFGQDKKCMSDKTIAEIHGMEVKHVRERITSNIKRFKESIDFIDLKQRVGETGTLDLLNTVGYSKQSITQAEHIYLLSERGYAKLIKIMDTDLAWEIHDKLIDEYFQYREGATKQIPSRDSRVKAPLSSANNTVKIMTKLYKEAGVDPTFIAVAAKKFMKEATDLDFDAPITTPEEHLYDKTTMAEMMGVYSNSGNPHPLYIGAVMSHLCIASDEVVNAPYTNHGHSGVAEQYKQSVYDKVQAWIIENDYPGAVRNNETGKEIKAKFEFSVVN